MKREKMLRCDSCGWTVKEGSREGLTDHAPSAWQVGNTHICDRLSGVAMVIRGQLAHRHDGFVEVTMSPREARVLLALLEPQVVTAGPVSREGGSEREPTADALAALSARVYNGIALYGPDADGFWLCRRSDVLDEIEALRARPASPGGSAPPRCEVTGNPVGTDTWSIGYPCGCQPCWTFIQTLPPEERARWADRASAADPSPQAAPPRDAPLKIYGNTLPPDAPPGLHLPAPQSDPAVVIRTGESGVSAPVLDPEPRMHDCERWQTEGLCCRLCNRAASLRGPLPEYDPDASAGRMAALTELVERIYASLLSDGYWLQEIDRVLDRERQE